MMIYQLSSYGVLKITGPQVAPLLQGQLTCDIQQLAENSGLIGAHCNPKGRVVSSFYLFKQADDYYMIMQKSMIPRATQELKKYALFFRGTVFEDVSQQYPVYGTTQPELEPNNLFTSFLALNAQHVIGFLPISSVHESLPETAWCLMHLSHQYAEIHPETSEQFLPHELALPAQGAVSFNKGCFTGQEIIARMHYKGQSKSSLVIRHLAKPSLSFARGTDIYDDDAKLVGAIVDYVKTDTGYQLLCLAKLEAHDKKLYIQPNEVSKPFYLE